MRTQLTPIIDQFGLENGRRENKPHNQTAVREPKGANNTKGHLFVLAEVQGSIAQLDIVEKQLVALIRDTYYMANGGITAGLRRAVQTANQWLYQNNVKQNLDLVGGIVAVVMREEDLFVIQVGPAVLFSNLNDFVRAHPDDSVWLDTAGPQSGDYASALGVHPFVDAYLTHLQIEAGDVLMLADSRLARQVSPQRIPYLLRSEDIRIISKSIAQHMQEGYCSALVIQIVGAQNGRRPFADLKEKIPASAGKISVPGKEKMFNFAMPAILQRPNNMGLSAPEQHRQQGIDDNAGHYEDDDYEDEVIDATDRESSLKAVWQTFSAAIMGTIAFLGSGLHTILKLVLPGTQAEQSTPQAGRQAQPATGKQPSYRALLYIAVAIPLIAILITAGMYWFKGYIRENDYQAALVQAEQKYQQARIAAPDEARILLNEVDGYLTEAQAIKPNQEEIGALFTFVEEYRDEINGVQRLYYVPELRQYTDAGVQPERVVVQGNNVYVLDAGLSRVFHHTIDDLGDTLLPDAESPVLLQQGQEIGDSVVNRLIDIVWMPAGGGRQTSDLLVLESDGIIEFDPDWGPTNIAVNGYESWQNPVAAGSFFGNLYLLDAGANQLYRYLPTVNGYENPPDSYFPADANVNLAGAVDMAIDGAIYILYQDGRIEKFLSGQPAVFQITGLDRPFNSPSAIFTAPDETTQYLYVADAGNKRIVQLTKEGQFIRQVKPRAGDGISFDNLRSIYVDELAEKMYVLNGNSLYAPNLPVE